MRLIDADALKGVIFSKSHRMEDLWDTAGILNLINNTPTVERPQGEWIVSQTYDCHSDIVNIYTCPFCGKKEYAAYPFCHCGAELKGDTE